MKFWGRRENRRKAGELPVSVGPIRHLIWLALACVLAANAQPAPENKPVYGPVKSMSPEEFEREMGRSKHYDFELASPDGLVDAQGTHIRAADLTAYFLEKNLDPAAYFLIWITNQSPPLDRVAGTVGPLGNYGATKIVFRNKAGGFPIPVVAEYHPPPGTPSGRTTVLRIRPNSKSLTAGLPFPDLTGRPEALRPGSLPPRVRYAFASDEAVMAAARLAADHLIICLGGSPLFARKLWVQPGAWSELKGNAGLGKKAAHPLAMTVPSMGRNLRLEGIILADPGELATLELVLEHMIAEGGGGEIRAMSTEEMARWWPNVSFDYVEPVLILQTKDKAHTFALVFENNRLALIDDLNGLPVIGKRP